ncbi:MAG: electron transfer flavoprotein subunit alpha/FixB family protein [Saprospiraceae bacterium]|nr:electron transfer flavoprotein subunit alpha/FixB family protein [Saprospiraceae bacterium]
MSVLVYIESPKGHIKKTGYEVASYAVQVAKTLGTDAIALFIGAANDAGSAGKYGVNKVLHANASENQEFDAQVYSKMIADIAKENGANIIILANTANGKALTGRLAIKMEAGSVSGTNSLPDVSNGFVITKSVYSGKAIVQYNITTQNKVLSVMGNTLQPQIVAESITPQLLTISTVQTNLRVVERKTSEGIVPLPEAELVVSAGRGMKGPENWAIIEDLAVALGATTACSRPVADSGWRPHHEHVGQTGVAIRPNLYIAAGISGAIQHLAGVNNSKVIVVINKDPEAPFFKAADYGVVGDLFDIVPKLTAAIKRFKHI